MRHLLWFVHWFPGLLVRGEYSVMGLGVLLGVQYLSPHAPFSLVQREEKDWLTGEIKEGSTEVKEGLYRLISRLWDEPFSLHETDLFLTIDLSLPPG
jgi:hypothetical protein